MRLDPRRAALFVAASCAAIGAFYLARGLPARSFGRVEAELVFQASRLQNGFSLYTDPAAGAWEMGPPPSRYYVLYTPLWPWILAKLSPLTLEGIRTVGRALNALLFLATLAAVVRGAGPGTRMTVTTGALLVLGLAMLAREVGTADADMAAVALCTAGLLRLNRRGGLDGFAAALLVAASMVKPSVLGVPAGAVMAHLLVHWRSGPRRLLAPLAIGGLVAGAFMWIFHAWSHGAWLTHIVRATGQRLSFDRWVQELGSRFVFLGLPHVVVCIVAVRRGAPLSATLPLATSVAWSSFSMAKHGSGTQYWLEPTMAALVALGRCPPAVLASRESRVLAWSGLGLALGVGGTSLPSLVAGAKEEARWRAVVAGLRAHCTLRPGEVIVSSDSTLELELAGRIVVPCWETSYLVRTGGFPLEQWKRDLARPDGARWFIHSLDYLEPPPEVVAGATETSAYVKELHEVMEANFVYDDEVDGMLVYRRR